MRSSLTVGDTVRHPRYGLGRVQAIVDGGLAARVYFEVVDRSYRLPLSELVATGSPGPVASSALVRTPKPVCLPTAVQEHHRKRLVVECLRHGLPPPGGLASWTVGFVNVRKQIDLALSQAARRHRGTAFVVEAGYGQGKSHVGHLARELAVEHRLLVMHAELDGTAVTLRNGSGLLGRLFASAVLSDQDDNDGMRAISGLGTVLRRAAQRLRGRVPEGLSLFSSLLEHAEDWEANEEAIERLEGYLAGDRRRREVEVEVRAILNEPSLTLPPLRTNYGRLEERREAQAEQLARIVSLGIEAGAEGGLIVLDELDHDFGPQGTNRIRAEQTLGALCGLVPDEPIVFLLLAPAGARLDVPKAEKLDLPELDDDELRQVTRRAIDAYAEAFPGKARTVGGDRLFDHLLRRFNDEFRNLGWGPRFFVRAAIEACDRAADGNGSLAEIRL